MASKTTRNGETKELIQELESMESKWKRAVADYQNLEKRIESQRATYLTLAQVSVIRELLPVYDDLIRASEHIDDSGLRIVVKQFGEVFEKLDITPIAKTGDSFDASTMECVEQIFGNEHEVLQVVQQGYVVSEVVIRPARVIVGNGTDPQKDSTQDDIKQPVKEEK